MKVSRLRNAPIAVKKAFAGLNFCLSGIIIKIHSFRSKKRSLNKEGISHHARLNVNHVTDTILASARAIRQQYTIRVLYDPIPLRCVDLNDIVGIDFVGKAFKKKGRTDLYIFNKHLQPILRIINPSSYW
jgi:hypothetical protein